MERNQVSEDDLKKAFLGEQPVAKKPEKVKKSGKNKKLITSVVMFVIGVITLVCGVVFLILKLNTKPNVADAEFLVEVGSWEETDNPSVIWTFTEVGKGKLTTNNHLNDYDFIWAIEGDTLKIEIDWLYTLNNEYNYTLDQSGKVLKITDGESVNINFRPASGINSEVRENN